MSCTATSAVAPQEPAEEVAPAASHEEDDHGSNEEQAAPIQGVIGPVEDDEVRPIERRYSLARERVERGELAPLQDLRNALYDRIRKYRCADDIALLHRA